MKMIRRASEDRLIELARGIVRGDLLIADPGNPDWQSSLFLMAPSIVECRNLGLILVPIHPHMGGLWLKGRVPAATLEARLVAKGDIRALQREVDRMNAALWPNSAGT